MASATDARIDTTESFENSNVDDHEKTLMNNDEVNEGSLFTGVGGSCDRTVGGSTRCGHWRQIYYSNPDDDSVTRTSISRILQSLREMESSYQMSDSEPESDSGSSDSEDSGNWGSETELQNIHLEIQFENF